MKLLALGGPAHLNLVELGTDAPHFCVREDNPEEAVTQSFLYKRAHIGVGSHPPVTFLIPAHLEGNPKDIAGWMFNQICQALMNPHPLSGKILLLLALSARESPGGDGRVFTAEVGAHVVQPHGIVGPQPLRKEQVSHRIDISELRLYPAEVVKERLRQLAHRAFDKAIDATIAIVDKAGELKPD